MKEQMKQAYEELLKLAGIENTHNDSRMTLIIKNAIADFVRSCDNPAVWCYGIHTQMLMADYIFEMKTVKYIIDEFCADQDSGGFEIIRSDKIKAKLIDGIIISSFKYRQSIKETLKNHFPGMKYLDIYQTLHEQGIDLDCEYYAKEYPYAHYGKINEIAMKLRELQNEDEKQNLFESLLKELIIIKDFQCAISCMEKYMEQDNNKKKRAIFDALHKVYDIELQAASEVSEKNVIMLCIDGLRRQDLISGQMEKIKRYIDKKGYFFANAYSTSTSTYESLIPTYSGNNDLRTKYYERNEIEEETCPFIMEAIRQDRNIYFYTDSYQYIKSSHIRLMDRYQTASEKLWDFLSDAVDEVNGLFYIHVLYESHFSYPNPYTSRKIVKEGTSILFDFLSRNGGKMKTDYIGQHNDALKYLDDLLAPVIERLSCRMVIYADHGNVLLGEDAMIEDVKYTQFTFGEELIQVPLAIFSEETGTGTSYKISSIMDLNDIIIHLLREEKVEEREHPYVKVVRSQLYNADFRYLCQKLGYGQGMEAFEVFLFQEGYKLAVYADGAVELYDAKTDEQMEDNDLKETLLRHVKDDITVCA